MTDNKPARGGARKGAGRKAPGATGQTRRLSVCLDDETAEFLREYGAGNLSAGIRRAAQDVKKLGAS